MDPGLGPCTVSPAPPPASHQPRVHANLSQLHPYLGCTNKIFSGTMLKNPNYQYGPKDDVVPARLHFGEFVLARMWKERNKEAFINGSTNESTTYEVICQQAMNFAVSLTLLGVRKGDTIAICSENRPEFYSVVVGVACAGAVVTTINPGYTEGELKHIIKISKPKFVILSPITFEMHNKFFTTHFNKRIILFGDEKLNVITFNDIAVSHNGTGNVVVNNRLARNVNFEEFEVVDVVGQTDTLFILYSSGTSGLPKGVMITHLNVLAQCVPENEEVSERKAISITPWFHALGLISMLQNLVLVRTTVYLPKFEVELYLKTIEKYKITGIVVVPPIIVAISKSPGQYDLSSVQFIHCGAAPLYSETEDLVKAKFPNAIGVFQGYGMTEATMALTTVLKSESDIPNKPGSVGTVMRGTVLKVVDIESRKVLGPNQAGEICAKGMMIMKGYVGREGQDLDDEGFFKTGDVGYFDEDGYFYIVDRLKELIKYKGFQVAPAEIEAELLQHPSVRDAGVIGVPDRAAGEVPLAFVVLQEGNNVSKEEIQQFIAERLSSPKHLRGGVRFVDVIPKNPSGKILRRTLRQMAKSKNSKL